MRIELKQEQLDDVNSIVQYIRKDRPNIAIKIYTEIMNKMYALSRTYKMYQIIGSNIRLMPVYKGKFRVLYDVDEINQVINIRVIQHHSQDMTQRIS